MNKNYPKFTIIIIFLVIGFSFCTPKVFSQYSADAINTPLVAETPISTKVSVFQAMLNAVTTFAEDIKEFIRLQRNPEIPPKVLDSDYKKPYVREPIDPSLKPAYIANLSTYSAKKGNVVAINGSTFIGVVENDILLQSGDITYNPPHIVVKDKRITFIVPSIPPGVYNLSVYGRGGLSNIVKFTIAKNTNIVNSSTNTGNYTSNSSDQSQYNSFFNDFYLQNSSIQDNVYKDFDYSDFDFSNFDFGQMDENYNHESSRTTTTKKTTIPLLPDPTPTNTNTNTNTNTQTTSNTDTSTTNALPRIPLLPEPQPQPQPQPQPETPTGTNQQNVNTAIIVNITSHQDGAVMGVGNAKFVATATGGTGLYDYVWDFGDGGMSYSGATEGSTYSVYHYYYSPGVYEASLYVKDANGDISPTKSITIIVNQTQ